MRAELKEPIARIIDPDGWDLFEKANALTKMNRRVSAWRISDSLSKANSILKLLEEPRAALKEREDGSVGREERPSPPRGQQVCDAPEGGVSSKEGR
jgi:hypothetical protein